MKKVISTALAVLLTVLCGCNAHRQSKKIVKAPKSDVTYTVALNPSVINAKGYKGKKGFCSLFINTVAMDLPKKRRLESQSTTLCFYNVRE